jgi:hypothetical protein
MKGICPLYCLEKTNESSFENSQPFVEESAIEYQKPVESVLQIPLKEGIYRVARSFIAVKPSEMTVLEGELIKIDIFFSDGICHW